MRTALILIGSSFAMVSLVALSLAFADRCTVQSMHGPRIGSVVRVGGCP